MPVFLCRIACFFKFDWLDSSNERSDRIDTEKNLNLAECLEAKIEFLTDIKEKNYNIYPYILMKIQGNSFDLVSTGG